MTDVQPVGAKPGLADRADGAGTEITPFIARVNKATPEIGRALPAHLKGQEEAFARAAITLWRESPGLRACDDMSILGGLLIASQLGLQFGPLGHAYLLPFKDKNGKSHAQFILGYKGALDLAWRSDRLIAPRARTVKARDLFSYKYGLHEELDHTPAPGDRGPSVGWYFVAEFKGGGHYFVVADRDEIEKHRKESKAKDGPAWKNHFDEMAMKTTVHMAKPYLPLTSEIARALSMDGVIASGDQADDLDLVFEEFDPDVPAEAELLDENGKPFDAPTADHD